MFILNSFTLDPDYAELEAAQRTMEDPDERAAREEEMEELNQISEALNTDPFSHTYKQAAILDELEAKDRAHLSSQCEKEEYDALNRFQEVEETVKHCSFWDTPLSTQDPPSANKSIYSDQARSQPPAIPPAAAPSEQPACPTNDSPTALSGTTAYRIMETFLRTVPVSFVAGMFFVYENGAYLPHRKDDLKKTIMSSCRTAVAMDGTARLVKQVFDLLTIEPRICRDPSLLQKNVLAFADCVLDLDSGEICPHTPDIFVTTRLKASFYAGQQSDCPVFKQFIHNISQGDLLLEHRIWEAVGYLLVPDQKGKAFILFQGVPNSGKSVLGDFIRNCFVGDVVSALEINDLRGNFVLADLVAKKICLDMDLPAAPLNDKSVSKLKKMTGKDEISSDVKFSDRARFYSSTKFLFGSNHAVLLKNRDEAFLNRLVTIPFTISVPKAQQDFQLPEKLAQERSAIIVQALAHYRNLVANDYVFSGNYRVNEIFGGEVLSRQDAIAIFLRDYCFLDEDTWTPTESLYCCFCDNFGAVCAKKDFSETLLKLCEAQNLPVEKRRDRLTPSDNPTYGFLGLSIK